MATPVGPTIQPDPSPEEQAVEFALPPELWEQIFAQLRGKHLLTVRQVCHRWKAIADRKRSLWTKMRHRVSCGIRFGESCFLRESWAPASSIRLIQNTILMEDSSWWVSLGEELTDIDLIYCTVTLEDLLRMLRHTPNLERLLLCHTRWIADDEVEPVVDFQLLKMKELQVAGELKYEGLGKVYPRLSSLNLNLDYFEHAKICRLIESVQGTLKRLKFDATNDLALQVSQMELLQLQHLDVTNLSENAALVLSQVQPSLEELVMGVTRNVVLCEIGRNLPRLRQLVTGLVKEETAIAASFLATMPRLKQLSLRASSDGQPINFAQFKCRNMVYLYLYGFQPVENSLQSFMSSSRNIQSLVLPDCILESWPSLLTMLAELPSLRYLELSLLHLEDTVATVSTIQRTNLEHLKLYGSSSITNTMIIQLCSLSSQIKELSLWMLSTLDDSTLQTLCRLLPQIARLTIMYCYAVSAESAGPLLETCRVLQELKIDSCGKLQAAVRKLLAEGVGGRYIELMDYC